MQIKSTQRFFVSYVGQVDQGWLGFPTKKCREAWVIDDILCTVLSTVLDPDLFIRRIVVGWYG